MSYGLDRYTTYAQLGQSCQTSLATLLDNRKFFPLDEPDYKIQFTKTYQYPGPQSNGGQSKPETYGPAPKEAKKGCCGN